MPELPEVEIAREQLESWLLGRRIRAARAPDPLLRGGGSRRKLEENLRGATTRAVRRRGKYLILDLGSKRRGVLAHLGMTGKFVRVLRGEAKPRFVRVELALSRGERVVLDDARRLGQFRLLDDEAKRRLRALGPEPLSRDFSALCLHTLLESSSAPIKMVLMDQGKIAGLGNIQVAEALFVAGIHPARLARTIELADATRLVRGIKKSLRAEIRRYRSTRRYLYEGAGNSFLVYGRGGDPCTRCGERVRRFVQGGRSSYYCPACQPGDVE